MTRRRTATALVASVVVVAGLVAATQFVGRPLAEPAVSVTPAPSPSPTAPESPESPESPEPAEPIASASPERVEVSAREIVADPRSRLVDVQSAPGDSGTRVALWRWCPDESCSETRLAVTLTREGSEKPTVADKTWTNALVRISAAGDAVVLDVERRLRVEVIRPDGSVAEADMAEDATPVAEGEVVGGVEYRRRTTIFWATDTTTMVAHPVPVPEDSHQLVQTEGGQLRVLRESGDYAWSDDGGASWNQSAGAVGRNLLPKLATSVDDTHVVVGGGDGATLFPFSEIRRLDRGDSWTVTEPVTDPMAYIGHAAVLPDGRFLVSVELWSDWRYQQPLKGTPPGLYVSDGDDWTSYERIEPGAPFDMPQAMQLLVAHISVAEDETVVTALGPEAKTAWTSDDLGVTWREMRVR